MVRACAVLIGFGQLNHTAACCYECAISSFLVVTRARTGHRDRPLRFDLTVVCVFGTELPAPLHLAGSDAEAAR